MTRTFQIPAILEGISTRKDGGLSMRFSTQEATDEEKVLAMSYISQFGWLLFSEQQHSSEDVEKLEVIRKDIGGKSPSQRLRSVLFVYYQQSKTSEPFETFYDRQIEKFITYIKQNLN